MIRPRTAAAPVLAAALTALCACGARVTPAPTSETSDQLLARATELARSAVLIDTHIDLPYRLHGELLDLAAGLPDGHFDAPRARAGGLDAAFMAIYVSASLQGTGNELQAAEELIDLVERIAGRWPDVFTLAVTPDQVREAHARGLIALPMGMENGAPIGHDLSRLAHFRDRGIRYITLTHSENNQICDSSYADERTWNGLSPFGREVVAEMNRLGIMIDVSHVSDQAFWQVAELTRAPLIASHSSCRHFTPGWERNMDDDMIRKLAELGGVIQVNFGSAFLTEAAQAQSSESWAAAGAYLKDHHLEGDSAATDAFFEQYWQEHTKVETTVADLADHIDHVVQLVGIDHVGLGSDFDGVSSLPRELPDVSGYPHLLAELMRRGYSDDDLRRICGGNLLRVWSAVEEAAAPDG